MVSATPCLRTRRPDALNGIVNAAVTVGNYITVQIIRLVVAATTEGSRSVDVFCPMARYPRRHLVHKPPSPPHLEGASSEGSGLPALRVSAGCDGGE